ncbi:hypothetical protein AB5J62_20320 [Amycolatopsis sp. cg5]|uniref:hypothetical protein n=1 Tax=Amycolatopsis sp. cg5 TaxID=3238802 RepID=UPI0035234B7D
MTSFQKRIVLKPEVTPSDFELVAWEKDWNLADMGREDAGASIDTWITDDTESEIHFVDDQPIGLAYLTLHGKATDTIEQQIRGSLEAWTLAEAMEALRDAHDSEDRTKSLFTVVLIAPADEDDAVTAQLAPLATDPDQAIRQSFIEATGYLPWPSLVALVEAMAANDSEQAVRENAQLLLEGLEVTGEGPGRAT